MVPVHFHLHILPPLHFLLILLLLFLLLLLPLLLTLIHSLFFHFLLLEQAPQLSEN